MKNTVSKSRTCVRLRLRAGVAAPAWLVMRSPWRLPALAGTVAGVSQKRRARDLCSSMGSTAPRRHGLFLGKVDAAA